MIMVKVVLTGVFLVLYSMGLQWLGNRMDITPLSLFNFIMIFVLLVVVVPLSLWSALQTIAFNKRN